MKIHIVNAVRSADNFKLFNDFIHLALISENASIFYHNMYETGFLDSLKKNQCYSINVSPERIYLSEKIKEGEEYSNEPKAYVESNTVVIC